MKKIKNASTWRMNTYKSTDAPMERRVGDMTMAPTMTAYIIDRLQQGYYRDKTTILQCLKDLFAIFVRLGGDGSLQLPDGQGEHGHNKK